jgi:hypothetical protein
MYYSRDARCGKHGAHLAHASPEPFDALSFVSVGKEDRAEDKKDHDGYRDDQPHDEDDTDHCIDLPHDRVDDPPVRI